MHGINPWNGFADLQCSKVLGGGEMWEETVDSGDILETIWPRAAGTAERL